MQKLDLNTSQPNSYETQTPIDEPAALHNNQVSSTYSSNTVTSPTSSMPKSSQKAFMITSLIAVIAGVITGFGGHKLMAKSQAPLAPATQPVAGENIEKGAVFGSQDQNAFKDSAQGYLVKGGLEGEGSHHILRAGGVTQTVYLTSSVTDLDALEGMEVKVWGDTFKAQKAGWLMDVGRVEVVNPKGEKPIEE